MSSTSPHTPTSSPYAMISIPQAVATVLGEVQRLYGPATGSGSTAASPSSSTTELVPLADALGRVLAAPVTAPDSLPPFPASIKDGYAVISSDGPGIYPVVGESRAGHQDELVLSPGSIAYITTGAPVPRGADAVVQVEDTRGEGEKGGVRRVHILKAATCGQDIRPIGSDIMVGSTVLEAGDVIGVAEVGILASVGAVQLSVYRRPHVGVLSTGDEVMDPASALGPGQIRDANRAMLLAAAAKSGARVTDLGIARDTEGHLKGCLVRAQALGVDVLLTSGGVSMGDKDLVKGLLEQCGRVHFGRVMMKPGKPLTFATLSIPPAWSSSPPASSSSAAPSPRPMLLLGLPGNPVSSFACFHLVALPALRRMSGWEQPELRRVQVRVSQELRLDPERPEYHRATVQWSPAPVGSGCSAEEWGWWAVSTGNQISSRLLSARSANVLLELPAASGVVRAGALVSALLIDDLQGMPAPHPVPLLDPTRTAN